MLKFVYDIFYQSLKITMENAEGIKVLQDGVVLEPRGFEFRLQQYAEQFIDKNDFELSEYQIFIRIH